MALAGCAMAVVGCAAMAEAERSLDGAGQKVRVGLDDAGSDGKLGCGGGGGGYAELLRRCGEERDLAEGRRVHARLLRSRARSTFLSNLLVQMYARCGALDSARAAFDSIPRPNIFSFNLMLAAYASHGHSQPSFQLFRHMLHHGPPPDKFTFTTILSTCCGEEHLPQGKAIHRSIIESGLEGDVFVGTALVCMYGKCGSLEDSRRVFDCMSHRDVVTWNAIMAVYLHHGHAIEVVRLFQQMQRERIMPNKISFINVLGACSCLEDIAQGKLIHGRVVENGFELDLIVCTSLVDMYGKCGSLEDARRVFDAMSSRDVVSWNAMIAAYANHGHSTDALALLQHMQRSQSDDLKPNETTFVNALSACSGPADFAFGKVIHASIVDAGFESDEIVGTALVSMYGKCGSLKNVDRVFSRIPKRDVVSWNAIIAAYTHSGRPKEALKLYSEMLQEGIKPDRFSFSTILATCSSLLALPEGKAIHASVIQCGLESDSVVATSLIDMYGKCGELEDARMVFDKFNQRDVFLWSAMIAAYAGHGNSKEVFHLFQQMQQEGIRPNEITFVSILSACSHAGLEEDASHYFHSMTEKFGIKPTVEHYGCMINLLGRAGFLEKAKDLIHNMPLQPDATTWLTLLAACKIHGDMERAKCAAKRVIELDPQNAAPYVVLSSIYAAEEKWDDAAAVRKEMESRGIKKLVGEFK